MTAVLIVEDNAQLARLFQTTLSTIADEVLQAKTLAQAFQELQHRVFDILVLDTGMPDGNGLIIIEYLRREPRHANTYIIVATGSPQLGLEASHAGADQVLVKPVSIVELRQIVRQVTLKPY
jgi:two-component system response regulator QseB